MRPDAPKALRAMLAVQPLWKTFAVLLGPMLPSGLVQSLPCTQNNLHAGQMSAWAHGQLHRASSQSCFSRLLSMIGLGNTDLVRHLGIDWRVFAGVFRMGVPTGVQKIVI